MSLAFALILLALGLKLAWSSRFDPAFRKKIRRVDRVVVVRIADARLARSFVFRGDHVWSCWGVSPDATVQLVWDDARTAVRAMLSKNPLDTFSAIGRGELAIRGNLQDALWFNDVAA